MHEAGYTLAHVLRDLGAASAPPGAEDIVVCGACADSRLATPGCLFVALCGERTDGHLYADAAFAAGATVALVERPVPGAQLLVPTAPSGSPVRAPVAVLVGNTLAALQRLADGRRAERLAGGDLQVVGVTGSVGKTTTKEAVAAVLAQRYPTLKSEGNYNNEIGLPLTLMALRPEHRYAVLEMGMYDLGEIAALCAIARPEIGVVTNVGPTHLERLGTLERIAQAKAELVQALPATGVAVLNGDDPLVRAMAGVGSARRAITYGLLPDNDVRAVDVESLGIEGMRFRVWVRPESGLAAQPAEVALRVAAPGRHRVWSALPAVAVGLLAGLSWEEIQAGLLAQGFGLRLVPRPGIAGSTLLDDTYNASPASVGAALEVLRDSPGRRIAVLGAMRELGDYTPDAHREVGERCVGSVDLLVALGEGGRLIAEAAVAAGLPTDAVHPVADNAGAVALLRGMLRSGDVVLVKGSRSLAMETIVQGLASVEPGGSERQ